MTFEAIEVGYCVFSLFVITCLQQSQKSLSNMCVPAELLTFLCPLETFSYLCCCESLQHVTYLAVLWFFFVALHCVICRTCVVKLMKTFHFLNFVLCLFACAFSSCRALSSVGHRRFEFLKYNNRNMNHKLNHEQGSCVTCNPLFLSHYFPLIPIPTKWNGSKI